MKKHHEILAEVNNLRTQLNKKPLKDWKGSNADLLQVRSDLRNAVKNIELTNSQADDLEAMKKTTKKSKDKTVKEIMTEIKGTKKADKAEGAKDRFYGVSPKIARAKLRKAFGSDWKNKTAAEIAAVLKK